MGGSPDIEQPTPGPYEKQLAKIAKEVFRMTDPIRQGDIQRWGAAGYDVQRDPRYLPMFYQAKTGLESQYNVARENILANMPRGGVQLQALGDLEAQRAGQLGSVPAEIAAQIMAEERGSESGAAWGAPQQSMAGLGRRGILSLCGAWRSCLPTGRTSFCGNFIRGLPGRLAACAAFASTSRIL